MTDAIPALVETVRTFVREELIPLEGQFLSRPFRELLPVLGEKRQQVRRLGLWAPHLPREWGGLGLSLPAFARLQRGDGPHAARPLRVRLPGARRRQHGAAAAPRHARAAASASCAPLARGDIRSCFAMTEPGRAGSNPVWLETTARRDGERLRDRRAQVVHVGRRRRGLRDRDGGDRCRRRRRTSAPARSWCRPTRPAGRCVRNIPRHGPRGRGLLQPRRGALEDCRVPVDQPHRRRRARASRSRRSASGPAASTTHALDRRRRARVRPAVRARSRRASCGPGRAARLAPGASSTRSPRAAPRSTPRACWCWTRPSAWRRTARPRACASRSSSSTWPTCSTACSTARCRRTARSA